MDKRKKEYIVLVIVAALCTGLCVGAFVVSLWFGVVCTFVCMAVTLMCAALIRMNISYTDNVIAQLSEIVASISSINEETVVPEYEDTLLSKLQSQAVKLSEMLIDQNRRTADEKNEIKSLISDISHQLKTPVAVLRTYGELLTDNTEDGDARREYLESFSEALEKLSFLTDSMVKLSRLESGIIVINPHRASLNDTVLSAVKQVFLKAKDKNIEIFFDSDNCEVKLVHDEKWTCEAIFNILDNAVKYTPPGGKVAISLCKYEMFARLDISDTGIGIAPDEQANIFTRFYRGSNVSCEDGIGIGLYLSRKVISEQNGYIKVKSDKDGSVFSVFLPVSE